MSVMHIDSVYDIDIYDIDKTKNDVDAYDLDIPYICRNISFSISINTTGAKMPGDGGKTCSIQYIKRSIFRYIETFHTILVVPGGAKKKNAHPPRSRRLLSLRLRSIIRYIEFEKSKFIGNLDRSVGTFGTICNTIL